MEMFPKEEINTRHITTHLGKDTHLFSEGNPVAFSENGDEPRNAFIGRVPLCNLEGILL